MKKKLNLELTKLLNDLDNTKNGSDLLIQDSKDEYNQQYNYNFQIIFGIFIAGTVLTVLFKAKVNNPN